MTSCHVCGLDGGNSLDIKANIEKIAKLEHEVHELKRTRSEAEAQARMAGYQEGQRDLKQSIRSLIGLG